MTEADLVVETRCQWFTPQRLRQMLLTVDGAGSGLDADLLDGISSALFSLKKNVSTGDVSDLSVATWGDASRFVSLCVNGFGYSTALLVNAYKVADTAHLYNTSGTLQTKYFGATYLGVQRPIMLYFDPNSNLVAIYMGTAGLNSGDLIPAWTQVFQANGSGLVIAPGIASTSTAPATASSTGTKGEIRSDTSYLYVCTATNTWKRVAISTF